MSKRSDHLLIEDILDSAQKILVYIEGYDLEQFLTDDKTFDAVVRNFEIIGEAANQLSGELKLKNSHIDWRAVIGFRNRLVHAYFGLDREIIFNVATENLPGIMGQINDLQPGS